MIAIYEDAGGDLDPDEFVPTALYEDGEWVAGKAEWEPYYPAGTPEAHIAEQLDGPSTIAVEVTEGSDDLKRRIQKDRVGPPQSELLGVGGDVDSADEDDPEKPWEIPEGVDTVTEEKDLAAFIDEEDQ